MSGDHSRERFDARNDYNAVRMQQGRVQLDADWNEQVELADRRHRAGALDVFGRCAVTSPTAFEIRRPGGPASLTIGRGRIYVDGILAENHGAEPATFDATLAELRGSGDVPYADQPYLPQAPALPTTYPYLVYVDVWQREVTAIERPDLVEAALGVDATTRIQTVWQVRALPSAATSKKDALASPAWEALTRPAAGRMTASLTTPPAPENPCLVPAARGYRGLDNRLYRVEIDQGGGFGAATFKWSRDNASVATRIEAIDGHAITVELVARDRDLGLDVGDVVEVTDDARELAGLPGISRTILGVGADRRLTLDGGVDGIAPTRNARLRRWDQATASIPVPAAGTRVALELGLEVSFALEGAGGVFRPGDHWVFAARSREGTIDPLIAAPPRGIHHHHGLLAIVVSATEIVDARERWSPGAGGDGATTPAPEPPAAAGCGVVVRPGESIQAAIDALPAGGGCVCLAPGTHEITRPIEITRSRVTLHGGGRGATIAMKAGKTFLDIRATAGQIGHVHLAELRLTAPALDAGVTAIQIADVDGVSLRRCIFVAPPGSACNGVEVRRSAHVVLEDNYLEGTRVAIRTVGCALTQIAGNELVGRRARDDDRRADGMHGIVVQEHAPTACRIERNWLVSYPMGIVVGGGAQVRVTGNHVRAVARTTSTAERRELAIEVTADHACVAGNEIALDHEALGGVRVTGDHARVAHNHVTSTAKGGGPRPCGILVGGPPSFAAYAVLKQTEPVAPAHALVEGNTLSGELDAIVLQRGRSGRVADNTILDAAAGIDADHEDRLTIASNRIENVRAFAIRGTAVRAVLLEANRVAWCGSDAASGFAIKLVDVEDGLAIRGGEIASTGRAREGKDGDSVGASRAIWIENVTSCRLDGVLVSGDTALATNQRAGAVERRALLVTAVKTAATIEIVGCTFSGAGGARLIEARTLPVAGKARSRVSFSNNRCEHVASGDQGETVFLSAHDHSVVGNHVHADGKKRSFDFGESPRIVAVANITSGAWGVDDQASALPQPREAFNSIG